VESVAWDPAVVQSSTTGPFYVGTADGVIYEGLIEKRKCKKFTVVRAEWWETRMCPECRIRCILHESLSLGNLCMPFKVVRGCTLCRCNASRSPLQSRGCR
jgi:hypothetical protein